MVKLIYNDGSVLTCYTIEDCGDAYFCDEYRIAYKSDIERIEYEEDE